MVFARRVGGSQKRSDKFVAMGSDTINTAAQFGADAIVDRRGASGLWRVDRRHVSGAGISVAGLRRAYLFYFGDVFTKERANDPRKLKN